LNYIITLLLFCFQTQLNLAKTRTCFYCWWG